MAAQVGEDVSTPEAPLAGSSHLGPLGLEPETWHWIRRGLLAAYAVAIIWYILAIGVPTNVVVIALVVVGGLFLTRVGQSWRRLGRVLVDWAPFVLIMVAYNQSRGLADKIGMPLHMADAAHAERWLFDGTEPTVWLQHHLYTPGHVHWYDAFCTLVYTTYFLATPVLAGVLWIRDRARWIRYLSRVVFVWVVGLSCFILFPEAPPWYAAEHHVIAPVSRLTGRGWIWLHAGNLDTLLNRAQSEGSNAVAAMPSLHTALSTLVAIFAVGHLKTRWRWLAALYPMAMGFTLVYTGEHYVIDLIAGVVLALTAHFGIGWLERKRAKPAPTANRESAADD